MNPMIVATFLVAAAPLAQLPKQDRTIKALVGVERIVFLGDSITYAGQYVEIVETVFRIQHPGVVSSFINVGLPSETVSGLSEPGHAGGSFPRPNLHERLERVLTQLKPDLVVACYGMNDGIYYPFGDDRFAAYQKGIRDLRAKGEAHHARILHLTPPVFDPTPLKGRTLPAGRDEYRQPYEGYDDVLTRYAAWLVDQRTQGWDVVDIHTPMKALLVAERAKDPKFLLAPDGVHANLRGHLLIARTLLQHWGIDLPDSPDPKNLLAGMKDPAEARTILELIGRKQRVLKDCWLTTTGHERPGMAKGIPLADAYKEVERIEKEIEARLPSLAGASSRPTSPP